MSEEEIGKELVQIISDKLLVGMRKEYANLKKEYEVGFLDHIFINVLIQLLAFVSAHSGYPYPERIANYYRQAFDQNINNNKES